jgi:hypothetical protein
VHALDTGVGSCVTWQADEIRCWRTHPAPHWLIELAWAPSLQPRP